MKKIIVQEEEAYCGNCDCELPKGSNAFSDEFDNLRCYDCYEDEMQGENYG